MRFFRDLILAILTVLAVSLTLEAALRLAHNPYGASFYQAEPQREYSLRPNAEGWQTAEGETYIQVNSGGFRGRERAAQPPAHTLRVAMVGSSEVAAFEVPLEQTFETAIERRLDSVFQPRGNRVEVLNFGVPGYTLAQEYLTLTNNVWKYHPQVVVLLWNQFNILKNSTETLPEGSPATPFYVLRDARLEPAEPELAAQSTNARSIALKNRAADVINSSYVLSMAYQAEVELLNKIKAARAALRLKFDPPPITASSHPPDYSQWWPYLPYLPALQEDWKISEAFLRKMKEDCDGHGAEFRLVIVDEQMQSHPDLAARKAFMRLWGLPSLDDSDKRLEEFCEMNGIGVLPLAPAMGEYAVAHNVALHGEGTDNAGHWNQLGHRIVGGLIADALLAQSPVVRTWAAGPPLLVGQ